MARTTFLTLSSLVAVALTAPACSSEIDNKPKAKVEDVKKVETDTKTAPPAAATRTLKLDAAGSSIGFVGAKVTGDHKGSFQEFEGEVTLAGDQIASLRVTVKTASVESDAPDLTNHLKSPDFFDVEKFPTAVFTANEFVAKPGENGATHEVGGELELHGVKKAIRFPAKITVDSTGAQGQAEFTINRKDFKIEYPGKPDDLIKDDVLLKLDLKFKA
ncbi:MAG TPA: YceI family protein [Nannocystis sp.]